ncbi:MAG: alpha/beta hydrolase [Acidobacteriia bacterium]|nr:alpha/beta hydrolase [Terriglobia bacterium]
MKAPVCTAALAALYWFAIAVISELAVSASSAPAQETLALWPKVAPGERGDIGSERVMTPPGGGDVAGKSVLRITNVTKPTITVFRPPKNRDVGAAVLVCPGGGYSRLAYDLEGSEICEWLNSVGLTGVLLKYRVPMRTGLEQYTAALQDAQRALGMVRHRAKEWGISRQRVGIVGFSAGGHLSAAASTNFNQRTYDPVDEADQESCRPDFALLIYPAYLTVPKEGDRLAPELRVGKNTPPTLLIQTEDDGERVESSLFYYLALKQAGVQAEMHLYATGGHGYGLRPSQHSVSMWPRRAEEWLRTIGVLPKK